MAIPKVSSGSINPAAKEEIQPQGSVTAATKASTGIDDEHQPVAISLNAASYDAKTVSVLRDVYFFSENEARELTALAQAIDTTESKLKVVVEPGLWERIKMLCYKLLGFLGNGNVSVYLHKDGMDAFNELKNTFLSPKNGEFTFQFLESNKDNPDVLKGFARLLGVNISGDINSIEEIYGFFVNPQLLAKCPDVKTFMEKILIPLSPEDLLFGINANLSKSSIGKKDWEGTFSINNQIFKDLGRNYVCIFHIDGLDEPIEIDTHKLCPKGSPLPQGVGSRQELAYKTLNDSISHLPEEMQERIREFCKNFPAQGVFAMQHPRLPGSGSINCDKTCFDVHISGKGIHVITSSISESGNTSVTHFLGEDGSIVTAKIHTRICRFEFDYHPDNGSSSNIRLLEYSGQESSID